MAKVGKPFVDIDTQDVAGPATSLSPDASVRSDPASPPSGNADITLKSAGVAATPTATPDDEQNKRQHVTLAVPAVRRLCKMHGIDISLVHGTGKKGRVLKEDVLGLVAQQEKSSAPAAGQDSPSASVGVGFSPTSFPGVVSPASAPQVPQQQVETVQTLSPTQQHMFKTMTRSLTIPHFLYADEVDFSELTVLRSRLNKVLAAARNADGRSGVMEAVNWGVEKLSYLPFIIKAVSLALYRYPILNTRVATSAPANVGGNGSESNDGSRGEGPGGGAGGKPTLVHRALHNVGVAMDTPAGLVVPVIKDVASRNVLSVASELVRLQKAAMAGKLSPADISGGTITVSNIGNIGGTYLSPVIVDNQVAILGVGRMRTAPAFGEDGVQVVKKQVCNFSWSADHRVVDGATMARAAEVVRKTVEEPDVMILHLR